MLAKFERLVGAAGDVKELEYISALHQTDTDEVRKDASIKAEDIQYFLSSRYGIKVDEETVRNTILSGLGGGSDVGDDVLDLMELVAILLIPSFLKAAITDVGLDELYEWNGGGNDNGTTTPEQPSTRKLPNGIVPTPPGMLQFVLKMILEDVTGDRNPKPLTPDLIRRILVAYGESALAADNGLVEEMYQAAISKNTESTDSDTDASSSPTRTTTTTTSNSSATATLLNVHSFAEALTHDIRLYDIGNEIRVTTNFDDVYVTDETIQAKEEEMFNTVTNNDELIRAHLETQQYRQKLAVSEELNRIDTIPAIDITAGTYRSKGLIVSLWATILITYFAYFTGKLRIGREACGEEYIYIYDSPWSETQDVMLCRALFSILNWMVFFFGMSTFGFICVTMGSIGNSVQCKDPKKPLAGFIFILLLVVIPYALTRSIPEQTENNPETERTENHLLYIASLSLGFVTCSFQLSQAASLYFTSQTLEDLQSYLPNLHRLLTSTISAEQQVKLATANKLSDMTENALRVFQAKEHDSVLNTHYGQALKKFEAAGKRFEPAGGFLWAWKRIFSRTQPFSRDGIWLPMRMIASNIAQYVVAIYVLIGGIFLADRVATNYDIEWAKRQMSYLVNDAFDQAGQAAETSGFNGDVSTEATNLAAQQLAEKGVEALFPSERYMIVVPFYVGTAIGFITALSLAVIYIPSVTGTILKLRCGQIPTLRNKDFNRYRCAPDQVALLTGSLFWGSLFSSAIVGGMVGLIVFFFVWQATVYYAQRLVAILIGIISVTLVRLAIVCTCRCTQYRSFYRIQPRAANISILLLEWGNFALSAGYILARSIKLLVAASTFIGRIDTPFLAHNVGRIGPIELDNYPMVHMKDVLSHEAHRHPYIEQLGVIYLMKLRYTKHFGQRAGASWRLIFVYALMPWLQKYRISARPEQASCKNVNDMENRFPSLKFVSLRSLDVLRVENEDDDEEEDERSVMPGLGGTVQENKRIRELEEEVQQLKKALMEPSASVDLDLSASKPWDV